MGTWDTESTQSTKITVGETFTNFTSGRNRGTVTKDNDIHIAPFGDDSVVGINATAIPSMKEALEAYIKEIEGVISKLEDEVSAREGVAGDDVNFAINQYFKKVKQYLLDLVSNFRVFNDKLSAVSEAYIAFQSTEHDTIQNSTNEINSKAYVEQYESPAVEPPRTTGPGHVAQPLTGFTETTM